MKYLACTVLVVFSSVLWAQEFKEIDPFQNKEISFVDLQERIEVFVPLNRISPKDILPFSGKLKFGRLELNTSPSQVVHVSLVTDKGELIQKGLVSVNQGVFSGYLTIPSEVAPGIYYLVANTQWMENYGEEYFFKTAVYVGDTDAASDTLFSNTQKSTAVAESGRLIAGLENQVIINLPNGVDVLTDIQLTNQLGEKVANVTMLDNQLGVVRFIPVYGHQYELVAIDGQKINLPEVEESGWTIGVNTIDKEKIQLDIKHNLSLSSLKEFQLIGLANGEIIMSQKLPTTTHNFSFTLNKKEVYADKLHITIINQNSDILAHRPIFLNNQKTWSSPIVASNNKDLNFNQFFKHLPLKDKGEFVALAITKKIKVDNSSADSIKSSSNRIQVFADDLALLVKEHQLNQQIKIQNIEYKYPFQQSLQVIGKVYDFEDNLLRKTEIQILATNEQGAIVETVKSDENGVLTLDGLWFEGALDIIFRTKGEKTKNRLVRLEPINDFVKPTFNPKPVQKSQTNRVFQPTPWLSLEDEKLIELEEVTVTETQQNFGFSTLGKPLARGRIKKQDYNQPRMLDELLLGIPGVQVSGLGSLDPSVTILRANGPVLWVLDGLPLMQSFDVGSLTTGSGNPMREIMNIVPANTIERIEVLVEAAETGIYGTRGAGGVIQIFTRFADQPSATKRKLGGIKLQGLIPALDLSKKEELKQIENSDNLLFWTTSISENFPFRRVRKLKNAPLTYHVFTKNGQQISGEFKIE